MTMDELDSANPDRESYAGPLKILSIVAAVIVLCAAAVFLARPKPEKRQANLIEMAAEAVEGNPNNASLRIALGRIYNELGQHDKALEAFAAAQRVARNDEDRATAFVVTGDVYQFGLKQPREALKAYRSAEELNPTGELAGHLYGRMFCLCCGSTTRWQA